MQRNAEVGLFTKPSGLRKNHMLPESAIPPVGRPLQAVGRNPVAVLFLSALIVLMSAGAGANAGSASPKVVILEFHGMKQGILDEDLAGLPNFQELIKGPDNEQAYVYLPRVLTTIPAASQPAGTAMYTGVYPQRTGVVSTIWFDRTTTKVCTLVSYSQRRINRILAANGVKSLFDYVGEAGKHSMTTMFMLTNGAKWSVKSGAFFWGNASVLGLFRNWRWFPHSPYVDNRTISGFLTGRLFSYRKSFSGIRKGHNLVPDVMAVQLLGTDLFSHFPARDLEKRKASMDEIQKHYARSVLDPLVGRVIRSLKKAGYYEDTVFVLVSEHGFTRIEKHIPDNTLSRSLRGHFNLPGVETCNRLAEAVIMLGACTKEVYLKNRQSRRWMDPPRLFADVKPAVDLILANPDVQTCMNTLVIRQYPGERDEGVAERDQWWAFDWRTYQDGAGDDLAFSRALRPLDSLAEHFELGQYVVRGLNRQYTRRTAPDIKLINKKGYYFERDFDKYGHHGSYYPADFTVSFWVAGPGLARIIPGRHVLDRTASTLDLVPMVTYLLGVPEPAGLDGANPLANLQGKLDGFVKSPTSALRCILRHCGVP
ncbi:MAG: alkaline phosphatase family protein [Desulfobacterales bacterium]|nr:alkaline phosphatase family protein [Desulfobacterales bacterium]